MKLKLIAGLLGCLALVGCSDSGPWKGPFGTKKGITEEQLSKFARLEYVSDKVFLSPQAPDMSAHADSYTFWIGKSSGLCGVAASFLNVASAPDSLPRKLIAKYGEPQKSPKGDGSVEWDSKRYKLEEGVNLIQISFNELGSTQNAMVSYFFDNMPDCH